MSSNYNGNGTNLSATVVAPVAISSSTNTSPIEITTSAPHGFVDGDTVQVSGHQTNTGANGTWVIAVTGASTFTLTGSTGVAVGGATGQAQDYAVSPLIQLPGDGDLVNAASVSVGLENAADAIPYLNQRVGAYNLHAVYTSGTFTSQTNIFSSTALTTSTWVTLTSLGTLLSAQADRYLIAGDILEVEFGTTVDLTKNGAVNRYGLAIGIALNGGAAAAQSDSVRVVQIDNVVGTVDYMPVSTSVTIASGFSANDRFDISILANKDSAAAYTLPLIAGYSLTVKHYRSNA